MPSLVLPPRATPDSEAVADSAIADGWSVFRLSSWRPTVGAIKGDIVLYGDPLFVSIVSEPLGVAPLSPAADWLSTLSVEHVQRQVEFTTLEVARRSSVPKFVKPAFDKCFPARVVSSGHDLPGEDLADFDTPVLVSEPVQWEVEFRFFIAAGKIVASSPYLEGGRLAQSPDGRWNTSKCDQRDAFDFVVSVLRTSGDTLPPGVALDVGMIAGRGWAVVEANAAWGSGLYGCDPSAVLSALQLASTPRAGVNRKLERWAFNPVWSPERSRRIPPSQ